MVIGVNTTHSWRPHASDGSVCVSAICWLGWKQVITTAQSSCRIRVNTLNGGGKHKVKDPFHAFRLRGIWLLTLVLAP